ncbi:MAG: hypothetical protein DHS20C15_28400 [Planctomycetota bacterium]|nr:MAG: hypothetical protein DHS20C15_28400 [Planctomycetota bacterium]
MNDRAPPRWILPSLLLLAVAVRLFAWSRAAMMMNDGPDFLWQAEQLLAGDVRAMLAHPYHPLYGALAAAFALLTGSVLSGALCVSVASGVALVGTSWWLARRLLPAERWLPVAAGLLAAISARATQYGADIQSDGLATALWLLGLAALLAAWQAARPTNTASRERSTRVSDSELAASPQAASSSAPRVHVGALLLAGVFTGLGYLTRPEVLALGLPALAVVLACRGVAGRVRAAVAYGVPLLVLLLPYVFAMHTETNTWGLSLKPSLQLSGLSSAPFVHQAPPDSPLGSPVAWRDRSRAPERPLTGAARRDAEATEAMEHNPPATRDAGMSLLAVRGEPVARAAAAALDDFVHAARLELLLLAIVGVAALRRRRNALLGPTCFAWCCWMSVVVAQLALVGYATNRHLLPAIVVLLPISGVGLLHLARGGTLLRVLLALLLLEGLRAGTEEQRQDHWGRLEALAWVAEHTPEGARFATHRRRDAWYAQRPILVTQMPVNDADFQALITEHNVQTFVFDERRLLEHHPDWPTKKNLIEVARFGQGEDVALVLRPTTP